ncbi:MAG: hypothetical protein WBB19_18620 [Desulforhopalus sp.]
MAKGEVLIKIEVLDNGKFRVFDKDDKEFKELAPQDVGETFIDRNITNARFIPSITYLESNPRWVNILGNWYYM